MQASALSMQCEPIEEDLAWIETSPHYVGTEVFIHLPEEHKDLDLGGVSISYAGEVSFTLDLWPGDKEDKFGVIYLQKKAGQFSVLAAYQAGACLHEMKQMFNVDNGNGAAQQVVPLDVPAAASRRQGRE